MKILVAICSCKARAEYAMAQRSTWVKDCAFGDVVFFRGRDPLDKLEKPSSKKGQVPRSDEVILDVSDDYASLPEKVRAICRWADEQKYELMLKGDDDVIMWPTRVVIPQGHYTGWKQEPESDNWCSGLAYWLSRDAMKVIANASIPPLYAQCGGCGGEPCQGPPSCLNAVARPLLAEDRWVGKTLLAAGIRVQRIEHGGLQWVGRQRPFAPNIRAVLSRAYVAGEFKPEEMSLFYQY